MRHRVLFRNEFYTIEYNTIDNWVKIIWANIQSEDKIHEGYEKALQHLHGQNAAKLLDDQSNARNLLNEVAEWLINNWYPRAMAGGLKFHALVYTWNNYNHLAAEKLKNTLRGGIIQGFEDITVAKKWLCDIN